jgi:hypothetical protein
VASPNAAACSSSDGTSATSVALPGLREVLGAEPEPPGVGRVPREDDDALARHAPQLGGAGAEVAPVVDREDGHRRVEARVGEGQRLGARLHGRRGAGRALGDHHRRRLDRGDLAVGRLVAAGPAPTLTIVRASPSAAQMRAAMRGSVWRVAVYVRPMSS